MKLLLPLIILLCLLPSLVYPSFPNSVDREALLAIKSQISDDPHGVLGSWNHSLPLCQWKGVTCGTRHPQRVVILNLISKDLVGTLSPFVGNLSFLHQIRLINNTFRGHIPSQIGHLRRLKNLGLANNIFEGQIPANISRCLNLQVLSLGGNYLTGVIPPELGFLSNLEQLSLHKNHLVGDLLNKVIINLTSIQMLSAAENFFVGSIPDNIGAVLRKLNSFYLGGNNISGTIPPSFYNLSNLELIDLSYNKLQGTLPLDIGFCLSQLTRFQIDDNFFHGNLPASLSNLTQLEVFSVRSNNFTGKIMFSASNMPNLIFFDVSFNYLGAREADDLGFLQTLVNCTQLQNLECSSNNFGGILPNSLGVLSTKLIEISLGQNQIVGNIPPGIFNYTNLRRLNLADNFLTGQLSPQIEKLTKLEAFTCRSNNLVGNIPYSLGNLSRLSLLLLANNSFEGMIPSSLGKCKNLLYLVLSENKLRGDLAPDLFLGLSMLVQLNLDRNNLGGVIPMEIGQLRSLLLLDISGNTFSGELPSSLSSCISLVELYMGANSFTGSIPESYKSLTSMMYLNMSHNLLSGQIPHFMSKLSLIEFDLSFNNLEGEVPTTGVFRNFSGAMIFGNSKLCGGIPALHLPSCQTRKNKVSVAITLIIAISSLAVVLSIISSMCFLLCFRRKQKSSSQDSQLNFGEFCMKLSYDALLKATDGFSEVNLLGTGHYGSVYKGVLDPGNNMVVAVKVARLEQRGATKSFMAESEALRNTRHRNLLRVLTVCSSTDFQGNDFKALVYEFMPNGNLHEWIHYDERQRDLSLLQRVNIALDVGNALNYLHNGCDAPIIHSDLKPSNILLDNGMVAHVGDFGLARFLHPTANTSSSIAIKGTVGYAAPEYGVGGVVSMEGDIYSYGVVLLELMTAKSPIDTMFEGGLDLHKYANSALSDGFLKMVDPRLLNDCRGTSNGINRSDEKKKECIGSVIEIGVKCSAEYPQNRMRIEDAITELQITRDIWLKELRVMGAMLSYE